MGVERYTRNVIGALRLPRECSVSLFLRRAMPLDQALGEPSATSEPDRPPELRARQDAEVRRIATGPTFTRVLVEMIWLSIMSRHHDVVFSINNFGPLFGKRGQRRHVVVHDVWFLSERYEGPRWRRIAYSLLIRLQVSRAHRLYTPTHFSRREIHRLLGVPLSRITLAPMCLCRDAGRAAERIENFFLLVGSARPNKNVVRAIDAYRMYLERGGSRRLVVAGHYPAPFVDRVRAALGEYDSSVVFEGFVTDERLEALLSQCKALVFVSLYEGYGIPVLEALLRGKPSVVARGTSCEEVQQGYGVVVDGSSTRSIADGFFDLEAYDTAEIERHLDDIRARAFDCEHSATIIERAILG